MGYTVKAPANYFLSKYKRRKISPLKLQKLVYISHGWHMALYDDVLVDDEFVEAWRYGPVFPSLYHEFKEYGADPITREGTDLDSDFELVTPRIPASDARTTGFLDKIWEVYGGFTGSQLSAMTHAVRTPWYEIWNENPSMRNRHIPNDLIKKHYQDLAEQRG